MDRDIVERLKDGQPDGTAGGYLLNDAADEIIRLRLALSGNDWERQCSTCKHAATPDSVEPCASCFKEVTIYRNHEAL